MKLSEMEADLHQTVDDKSLAPFYKDWINDAILQIAADFELPALKLINPVDIEVDSSDWLWELPADFHKKLSRCVYYVNGEIRHVHVHTHFDEIAYRDHLTPGDKIVRAGVAVQGEAYYLGIDPIPNTPQTLKVWYYRKPKVMVKPDDVPDLMPPEFHQRVILPLVIVRNYEKLLDQVVNPDIKPIQYYQGAYSEGLYGAKGRGPGLINYLAKTNKPPRRHGGRDPIGGYYRAI